MLVKTIDINCDLGEGVGNESALMPLISSCNIACGGHAGDVDTMTTVVKLAKLHNVKIGAHPSFPDKENFGRVTVRMSPQDLFDTINLQIENLKTIVENQQLQLHHVKLHGALYNLASVDVDTAKIVVSVIRAIDKNLVLYVPYGSVISKLAHQNGISIMYEGFADRNYNDDLTLVSRKHPKALIHNATAMFNHVYNMVYFGNVTTINEVEVKLKVDTICVHSDGKNVIKNLRFLIKKLNANAIHIS
nr:5-oxoprolinase subunit PxpA [uncultured Psychroserpens sp.]